MKHLAVWVIAVLGLSGCETNPVPAEVNAPFVGKEAELEKESIHPLSEMDNDSLFMKADELKRKGKANESLFYFVNFLEREPHHTAALTAVGEIHLDKGNLELAETALAMALTGNPDDSLSNELMGIVSFRKRDYTKSERHLVKARKGGPASIRTLSYLGLIKNQKGQHEQAESLYFLALSHDPQNLSVKNQLAYSQYLRGQFQQALTTVDEVLRMAPTHMGAKMNRSRVLMSMGKKDEALANYRSFLSESDALNNLGFLCLETGDYSLAREYFEKAIQRSPGYHDLAHQNLKRLSELELKASVLDGPVHVAGGAQ
jgi:Flp pilus assembly protein TadD